MTQPWRVRDMRDDDIPFIATWWLKGYAPFHYTARARSSAFLEREKRLLGAILYDRYMSHHRNIIHRLLKLSRCVVACSNDDDSALCGFAVVQAHEGTGVRAVHWVSVKPVYRDLGIARSMVEPLLDSMGHGPIVVTHVTSHAQAVVKRLAWPHVPYLAFLPREERAA